VAARPDRGLALTAVFVLLAAGLAAGATEGLIYAAVATVLASYIAVLVVLGLQNTGILLMILAFAAAPMYRGIEFLTGGSVPPTDIFVVAGIIHLAPGLLHQRLKAPPLYLIGLVLLASWCLASVIITGDLFDNAFHTVQWLFFIGALPLFIAWWRPSMRIVEMLLWGYLAGHVISTAGGAAEGPVYGGRYDGLTHHVNAFGLAGVVSIAIVFFLLHRHKDFFTRLVLLGVVAVSIGSIVASGSRAAIVVLVVLALLVPVVERSALVGVGLAGAIALVVLSLPLIVAISGEGSAIGRLVGEGTAAASDGARVESLDLGIDRFWQSPIVGSGFTEIELIHNVYLEVAVAIGVLGLVSYLIVMFAMAVPVISRHPLRRLTFILFAFLGVAPTFPGLWDRTVWVPACLVMLAMLDPRDLDLGEPENADETEEIDVPTTSPRVRT
jgi:O-antigen ligase